MTDTAYTIIKDFIKTKLDAISKLQEVSDDPTQKFNGFPAATITPSNQESDYETSDENMRVYAFEVRAFQDIQEGGLSAALDALYDLSDDVLDAFDQDETFSGISLPTGYTMIAVRPANAGWEQDDDSNLLVLNIKLNVVVSVSIS